MADGAVDRIVVKHSECQTQDLGLVGHLGDEIRAADGAEASMLARRGLVVPDQLFASDPAKLRRQHLASRSKGRTMRLATHGAVTVQQVDDLTVDLEGNALAKATSAKHCRSPMRPNV